MSFTQRTDAQSEPDPLERHFTAQELAEIWKVDQSTIRRMFHDVPGVLKIGNKGNRRTRKRSYCTMRIPESVVRRYHSVMRS